MSTQTSRAHRGRSAVILAAVLLAASLGAAQPAESQSVFGYFPKFVCGFQTGNVPLLNDPNPPIDKDSYEAFKPGNYATTVNITNTTLNPETVSVYAMVTTGDPTIPSVRAPVVTQVISGLLGLGAGFGTNFEVDCQDIADAFTAIGLPPPGSIIEGNLFILPNSGNATLQVDAVYSYESQNAFERHVLWGNNFDVTTNFGEKGTGAQNSASLGDLLKRLEAMEFPGFENIAASGAGGLGLGASIDVERCPAVEIDISSLPGGMPDLKMRIDGDVITP